MVFGGEVEMRYTKLMDTHKTLRIRVIEDTPIQKWIEPLLDREFDLSDFIRKFYGNGQQSKG